VKSVALGDVCEVTTGQSAPQDHEAFGQCGTPFVRAGSLERLCAGESEDTLELVEPEKARRYRLKLYPANTVVFPKSGMSAKVGRVYRLGRDCHLVSHLAAVLPSTQVDSSYLHRWFEYSPPSRLIENDAYPSIKTSTLKKLQIPLPPLPEQRRIAAILDKADALRAKRRDAIAKLDQLLQSVFLGMFGNPASNPKNWPVAPLGSLCINEDARRKPIKQSDRDGREGPYPYYGASGVIDSFDDYLFDGERLLVAEDGANLVARSSPIAFMARGRYWVNNHAHVLAASEGADLRFIERALELLDLEPYITGSAQPKLNQANLERIELPVPPLEMQRRFRTFCERLESERQQAVAQLDSIGSLFSSLQMSAFLGANAP